MQRPYKPSVLVFAKRRRFKPIYMYVQYYSYRLSTTKTFLMCPKSILRRTKSKTRAELHSTNTETHNLLNSATHPQYVHENKRNPLYQSNSQFVKVKPKKKFHL